MSRLSEERLAQMYARTLALVVEHGFDNVTMDQVADATHSSKATLYRQWGSKVALVVAALKCSVPIDAGAVDTGSLRGDFHAMIARRSHGLSDQTELIPAILHAVKSNPDLASALREQVLATGREHITTVLARAVERGEVAADCPALPHIEVALMAPFVLYHLINGEEPDDDHLLDYVDAVLLPALGTR